MGFFSFDQLQDQFQELWSDWKVRAIILFSLLLQSFLILVSPFRTKTANGIISVLLWLAYLLADAAATFAFGLICRSQGEPNSADKTIGDLLAFWAPILLIHLGGPDTITALALEDNELWQRHLLQLLTQLAATLYVLDKSLTRDSELLAPTILVLIVGIIKYGERVYSLYHASGDQFRDSLLTKPDTGFDYAKLMKRYRIDAGLTAEFEHVVEEIEMYVPTEDRRSDLKLVQEAYRFFTKFKGLVADLIFSKDDWRETRGNFSEQNAERAFRIMEIELNFLYEALYTKMPAIRTWVGYILRLVCFVLLLVSFFLWHSMNKSQFRPHDVKITYALLGGAITHDVIAFFMLIFSDWSIANVMKGTLGPEDESQQNKKSILHYILKRLINRYLAISDRRYWSGYSEKDRTIVRKLLSPIFCFWRSNSEDQGDERTLPLMVMASRIFYRRWSESVQQFNLIDYCVNERSPQVEVACGWVGLKDFLDGVQYVPIRWFSESLRDSIFSELKAKSEIMKTPADAHEICEGRGEWVLKKILCSFFIKWTVLKPWLSDVHYDESVILWHIATEICYNHGINEGEGEGEGEDACHVMQPIVHEIVELEEDIDAKQKEGPKSTPNNPAKQEIDREVAKTLSDYMFYLLILQPKIMTTVAGIGRFRFRATVIDTCSEAKKLLRILVMERNEKKRVRTACSKLLELSRDSCPKQLGDRSKSLLFEGCRLARVLDENLGDKKWIVIHKVWVEMLSYAATNCSGNTHAAQLSKGGQLITFVWLLMAHLGLGKQFEIM